jgi:hypothetical protein
VVVKVEKKVNKKKDKKTEKAPEIDTTISQIRMEN